MKAVILAGGLGTRLSEETNLKPKPMVEIGSKPILWHIMKIYASYGIKDFIICCGYKGYLIKEYFANYQLHMSNITFDMESNNVTVHQNNTEDWSVTLVDTGEETMTGGRLLRVYEYVKNEEAFCFTYGDGLSNVNISKLIDFHFKHDKPATLTAAIPPARFGALKIDNENKVYEFQEKANGSDGWINGGYFVLHPSVIKEITSEKTCWEEEPLKKLASKGNLVAFKHNGFWQPMDTLREKILLNNLWESGSAPWKTWD